MSPPSTKDTNALKEAGFALDVVVTDNHAA